MPGLADRCVPDLVASATPCGTRARRHHRLGHNRARFRVRPDSVLSISAVCTRREESRMLQLIGTLAVVVSVLVSA